jgi:hypothetical protein
MNPAYKQAVVHRDNWFMSLSPQRTNKEVAYTNDAVELERTESINEGMDTANRALNVLDVEWDRTGDYTCRERWSMGNSVWMLSGTAQRITRTKSGTEYGRYCVDVERNDTSNNTNKG